MGAENLGILLAETARAWRNLLDKRLRPLGLSQAKWMVLLFLARDGDGLSQKQLSESLGIEGPSLVGTLDRMEENGWVERRISATDRRAKAIHRTDKAIALTEEIKLIAATLRGELLQDIPAIEIEQTMNLLSRLKQRVEQIDS
ncbi:MAG: MarR family transcriptional regulator [Chromatiales bacterium]|nr:MarR family transcriptional regulator [Chromatiales bacterium]